MATRTVPPKAVVTRRVRGGYTLHYEGRPYSGGTEITGPAEELERLWGCRLERPLAAEAAATVQAKAAAAGTAEGARRAALAAMPRGDLIATAKAVLQQRVGKWSTGQIIDALIAHEAASGAFSGPGHSDDAEVAEPEAVAAGAGADADAAEE